MGARRLVLVAASPRITYPPRLRLGNAATTDVTETFTYDGLNRLTASTIGQSTKSLTYSATGNILSKSDVGTYLYGNPAKPHAVTATNGLINATYTYDANGNQEGGSATNALYTAFDKPPCAQAHKA